MVAVEDHDWNCSEIDTRSHDDARKLSEGDEVTVSSWGEAEL